MTRGPDGRWTALDGQAFYRSSWRRGWCSKRCCAIKLSRRLGVTWRPVHDHVADIAGIPQSVLTHFSKRRNEIEDELERTGRSGPAAAGAATLATRTAKVEVDQATLDQRWLDDADSIGYGPVDIDQLLADCSPAHRHWRSHPTRSSPCEPSIRSPVRSVTRCRPSTRSPPRWRGICPEQTRR